MEPENWREMHYLTSGAIKVEANKHSKVVRVILPCGEYRDFYALEMEKLIARLSARVAWLGEKETDTKTF